MGMDRVALGTGCGFVLLGVSDRLVVWAYTALNNYPAAYTANIAGYIADHYDPDRFIVSVGMWNATGGSISPVDLEVILRSSQAAGVHHLWITPSHMMTETHWAVVEDAWEP